MGYGHLSIDERESIMKMAAQGFSYSEIGQRLGRHKGTISREWRRNVSSTGEYLPHLAQRYYRRRRASAKEPYRLEEDDRDYITALTPKRILQISNNLSTIVAVVTNSPRSVRPFMGHSTRTITHYGMVSGNIILLNLIYLGGFIDVLLGSIIVF